MESLIGIWLGNLTACPACHYGDVIMGAIASQITSLMIVYSTVYSDADQRKHQSSASLAFVWGIHRGPVNSPHKWPVTQKMFPFDDVIMSWWSVFSAHCWATGFSCKAHDIDGLVQYCSNSSALAMELLQSCTKPPLCIVIVCCPISPLILHLQQFGLKYVYTISKGWMSLGYIEQLQGHKV